MLSGFGDFWPLAAWTLPKRALSAIFSAIERGEQFPQLGRQTDDTEIRQIVVHFGATGYIVRYSILPGDQSIVVLRIWHGREARS